MAIMLELHWIAFILICFTDVIKSQRRDEGFNSFGGRPLSPQNIQTGQRIQTPPQSNQQQRWSSPAINAGNNRQLYNSGSQQVPSRVVSTEVNRPYNRDFQQSPQGVVNNANSRPIYNIRPRPPGNINNGYNGQANFEGPQRRPPPSGEINRPLNNAPQRPFIATDNGNVPNRQVNNVEYQRVPLVANNFGVNRAYNNEQPSSPSSSVNSLRNRPVYYDGPQRRPLRVYRNESNTPIYIRRAQRPRFSGNLVSNRPIYVVGGPVTVIDNEPGKPLYSNAVKSTIEPSTSLNAEQNNPTNSSDFVKRPSTVEEDTQNVNIVTKNDESNTSAETSIARDQSKSFTSKDSKLTSSETNEESPSPAINESTQTIFQKSDKIKKESTLDTPVQNQSSSIQPETTTLNSIQNLSSSNTSMVTKDENSEENK